MSADHIRRHTYADPESLARALAERVEATLREGVSTRGQAVLAVSGGSTPVRFFEELSHAALDWARVTVTLVDERWVDEASERSNARLVKRHLLKGPAAAATFVPLYTGAETPEAGCAEARRRIAALPRPFDAVVLGMGEDGHTASFFPGGDRLAEALDPDNPALVVPMRAQGAGEPRITLTLPLLLDTRLLVLHIEGETKHAVLEAALAEPDPSHRPVSAVLQQPRTPVEIYWAP